jgi:hypothetical protein
VDRLVELIMEAVHEDARRVTTRPGTGVKRRRRADRERLSKRKAERRQRPEID